MEKKRKKISKQKNTFFMQVVGNENRFGSYNLFPQI